MRSYDHVGKRRRRRRTKSEAAPLLTRLPAFLPDSHHSLIEGEKRSMLAEAGHENINAFA